MVQSTSLTAVECEMSTWDSGRPYFSLLESLPDTNKVICPWMQLLLNCEQNKGKRKTDLDNTSKMPVEWNVKQIHVLPCPSSAHQWHLNLDDQVNFATIATKWERECIDHLSEWQLPCRAMVIPQALVLSCLARGFLCSHSYIPAHSDLDTRETKRPLGYQLPGDSGLIKIEFHSV